MKYHLLIWSCLLWVGGSDGVAGEWPGFRGPSFDGANQGETSLPTFISKEDYVQWRTPLPGLGSSTPAVWQSSVFITAIGPGGEGVQAIKLNFWTGEIEWAQPISTCQRNDRRSDMAGPSPATDGSSVIFVTGAGEVVCCDFGGNQLWTLDLPQAYGGASTKWSYSSSPVIRDGLVFLQILQQVGTSYVVALDVATGKEIWRNIRQTPAVGRSRDAYSTPVPITHQGRSEVLVVGSDCITGYAAQSGQELWRWDGWNRDRVDHWRMVSSPVYGNDMIAVSLPKGQAIHTLFAGAKGPQRARNYRWHTDEAEISCDITTPVFLDGHFYFLNGRKRYLSCVDSYSGEVKWLEKVPSAAKIEASPTAGDGKLYLHSHTGEVFVYRAGEQPELLHSVILGSDPDARNRASIVPANGRLLIRVGEALWCFD